MSSGPVPAVTVALTARALFRRWLPTCVGSGMLVTEIPVVAAAVARSPVPDPALAAFGVGVAVIVVTNSPALALAPLVVAWRGRVRARSLRTYTALVACVTAAVVLVLGLVPAVPAALLDLAPDTTAELGDTLLVLAPASATVAVRRHLHGRLVSGGTTRGIAVATVCRLAASATVAWALAGHGAAGGAAVLLVGAAVEASVLAAHVRRDPEDPALPAAGPATMAVRHAPAGATRAVNMVPQLAASVGIAHAVGGADALTAWPVLYGLLSLFTGPLSDVDTVAAGALREAASPVVVHRFAVVLMVTTTTLYGVLLWTPLLGGYLTGFSGLSGPPLALGLSWTVLSWPVPAVWALRGYLRAGILAGPGPDQILTRAVLAHTVVFGVVLAVTVTAGLTGVVCAFVALLAGVLAETVLLARRPRRAPTTERIPGRRSVR